ncbi:substrate-binding periplasmic protein [Stutzerimonas stutzeri]|uniref:substrate-binding periplasmic protein n=1 Tax=Stutzerimonas stutzeri TaxID=316 RepID=UPI0015E2DD78|nr:transporter substrate-binding domain-containing protein [Stutzerimonas stutzeri]MBA1278284.1 transporter substrate-binding domain-containing protein [Stutzerimonas stutzeri]
MKKFLAVALLALSVPVAAEQTYVIGVEQAAFMPHYSGDAQGNYGGFARELLDSFAAYSGVRLTYKVLPADELLPALLNGRVDAKYPDNPNWSGPAKAGHRLHYSQAVVNYVDGVMVAPRRVGRGIDELRRLAVVDGWTPWGYEDRVAANQILLVSSESLPRMVRQALLKDSDGAYYNVVVAAHYLNNVRAKPGALVFDADLPHTRSTFNLSSLEHPELIEHLDRYLKIQQPAVAALKAKHQVEANLSSEYIGMEQWKIEFLQRQKAKEDASN